MSIFDSIKELLGGHAEEAAQQISDLQENAPDAAQLAEDAQNAAADAQQNITDQLPKQ
jgi:hypothetical protein